MPGSSRTTPKSAHLTRLEHRVSTVRRECRNKHVGGVFWLTGLSGSGKSTLAFALEGALFQRGYQVYVLDGDNMRHGLNRDLAFSQADRAENVRRVGEVAALFADAGFVCVSAFISPYRSDRHAARVAAEGRFHEVFLDVDLATCEERDPKGLYKLARAGEIADFTGVSAPYEKPEAPELVIPTGRQTIEQSIDAALRYIVANFRLTE